MEWKHIIFAALLGFPLAACTPSLDMGALAPSLAPLGTQVDREQNVKDQKLAICEWGKQAGLPHSGAGDVRRSITESWVTSQSKKDAFLDYYKRVTATSVAYECTCGDEARQKLLKCDELAK